MLTLEEWLWLIIIYFRILFFSKIYEKGFQVGFRWCFRFWLWLVWFFDLAIVWIQTAVWTISRDIIYNYYGFLKKFFFFHIEKPNILGFFIIIKAKLDGFFRFWEGLVDITTPVCWMIAPLQILKISKLAAIILKILKCKMFLFIYIKSYMEKIMKVNTVRAECF